MRRFGSPGIVVIFEEVESSQIKSGSQAMLMFSLLASCFFRFALEAEAEAEADTTDNLTMILVWVLCYCCA